MCAPSCCWQHGRSLLARGDLDHQRTGRLSVRLSSVRPLPSGLVGDRASLCAVFLFPTDTGLTTFRHLSARWLGLAFLFLPLPCLPITLVELACLFMCPPAVAPLLRGPHRQGCRARCLSQRSALAVDRAVLLLWSGRFLTLLFTVLLCAVLPFRQVKSRLRPNTWMAGTRCVLSVLACQGGLCLDSFLACACVLPGV